MHLTTLPPLAQTCRRAALAIGSTTAMVLLALSHHPVASRAASVQESLAELVKLQFMDGVVHGVLMLMLAILAAGFGVFSGLLGRQRPPVIAAMAAYGLGCCVIVGAMLLDGFAIPQMAASFAGAPYEETRVVQIILRVIGTLIQVLTKAGLVSMCAALLAWSYALATGPALAGARWCATVGAVAGLASGLFILFGGVRLTPGSLMAVFGVHALWNFAVAALLVRPVRAA